MTPQSPILVLDRADCELDLVLAGRILTRVELDVLNTSLRTRVAIADTPARLADLVPLARTISDDLAALAIQQAQGCRQDTPCRDACPGCCKDPVPLSVPEAFALAQEIDSMPPRTRARLFKAAAAAEGCAQPAAICPMLLEGPAGSPRCGIYPRRPSTCRQYVAAAPGKARRTHPHAARSVQSGIPSVREALALLAAQLEHTQAETVALPLAPTWVLRHLDRAQRTWGALQLVEEFSRVLRELCGGGAAKARTDATASGTRTAA